MTHMNFDAFLFPWRINHYEIFAHTGQFIALDGAFLKAKLTQQLFLIVSTNANTENKLLV